MVLCQFFLSGNCRFGTKCFNDHIDLKQLIRVEIDSALKGNQWPISCFGPFKDKPCIPNFIEDQSFEEIRYKFYEAKINGNFEQVRLGFINLIQESKSKLQQLNMLSPEIMNIVVQLYDAGSEPKKSNSTSGNNPFATVNIGSSQPGNQAQNIFGKSSFAATTEATAANIFGGAASNQQQSNNIFGGGSFTSPNQTPGIFGSAQNQQPVQSIFGAPVQPSTSVFGQAVNAFQPSNAASQFSLPQIGNQPTQNVFGSPQPAQGIFGAPTQPQPTTNIFGGQTMFQQPTQPVQSVFAAPANQSPFGGGQQSMFGQQQVPQQPTPANVFQTQPPQPQQTNIFAQGSQTDPNTGQMRNNVFNQPMQQQPLQSAFSQPSPFQQPMPIQQQQAPAIQPPPFGQAQHAATQPVQNQPTISNYYDSCYSKLSELTPEELDAFKSDQFEVGKIPTVPPPRELC